MGEIKIEERIKMPSRPGNRKYPFPDMKIGDSFFVKLRAMVSARTAACAFAKRHPEFRFSTGIVDGGLRIWRVKA
ncbi:MAG: hypothetical protein IIB77_14755 [Proteobacteria bacterium]|nr:hypothetical protein [Pseudomonadota bacterium]